MSCHNFFKKNPLFFSSLSSNVEISKQPETSDKLDTNVQTLEFAEKSEIKDNIDDQNLRSSEKPQIDDAQQPKKKKSSKRSIDSLTEKLAGKKIKMTEFAVDNLPQEKVDLKNISILKPKKATSIGGKQVKAILVRKNGKTFVVQKKGTWASEFRKLQKKKQKELAEKISKAYETEDEHSVHEILLANLQLPEKSDDVGTELDKELDKEVEKTVVPKITIKKEKIDENFACDLCSDTFTDQKKYTVHMRGHVQNEFVAPYICHLCRKRFKEQKEFDEHMDCHVNEEMTFSCVVCSLKFHTEVLLQSPRGT